MIVEYTRYRVAKDRQPAFLEAYRNAQKHLKASPHCISYELSH
ncbi:MAG TPA: antibiotic biosynthesis monooxygenase, partial [Terriglobia bacterium]|nr:antibiotic biosynthesis monooxygenase [Terriglobia bacterium]